MAEPERKFGRNDMVRTPASDAHTTPLHFDRIHPSCHRTTGLESNTRTENKSDEKGGAAQEGTKKAWWGRPRPGVDKIGEVDSKSHSATQQPNYPPSYGGRGLFSGFYRRTNMCISHTSITSIINDCFPSAGFFSLRVGTAEVCITASRKKYPFIKV